MSACDVCFLPKGGPCRGSCGRRFGSDRTSWMQKRRRTKTSIDKSKLFMGDHGVVPCICSRQGICSSSWTCGLDLLVSTFWEKVTQCATKLCKSTRNYSRDSMIKNVRSLYWQSMILRPSGAIGFLKIKLSQYTYRTSYGRTTAHSRKRTKNSHENLVSLFVLDCSNSRASLSPRLLS